MTMDVKSSLGEMTWLIGRTYPKSTYPNKSAAPRNSKAKLALLPALAMAGAVSWMLIAGPSDAESQPVPLRSPPRMGRSATSSRRWAGWATRTCFKAITLEACPTCNVLWRSP